MEFSMWSENIPEWEIKTKDHSGYAGNDVIGHLNHP